MFFAETVIVLLFGLILGSFATALVYRVPRSIPWKAERSVCSSCETRLSFFDLIPIFSWCFAKGKCRHCRFPVSCRYPLIEAVTAFLCFLVYAVNGFEVESFFFMVAIPILISLFFIDLDYMILPNELVFILAILGFLRLLYFWVFGVFIHINQILVSYILGGVFYALVPWLIGIVLTKSLKKPSLGFGDVKFMFVSGLWLGIDFLSSFMITAGVLAVLFSLIWKKYAKEEAFPFGPALIISFYAILLYQGFVS